MIDDNLNNLTAFTRLDVFQHESLPEITANRIRGLIHNGTLKPGSQLPNEIELAEAMGVSRGTIRSALSMVQQQGLIWRKQGVGSFVSEIPILENRLDINFGVTDLIESMGLVPGTEKLEINVIPCDEQLAGKLNLSANTPIVNIKRVRTANGRPVIASTDIFAQALLESDTVRISVADLRHHIWYLHSVYRVLDQILGITVEYGVAKLQPIKVTGALAEKLGLGIPGGSVMLYLEQVDYDRNRQPIIVSCEYHVADFSAFTVYRRY